MAVVERLLVELRVGEAFCALVQRGASVLSLSDEMELPLDFSCRGGSCGTCVVEVLAGMENLSPATDLEEILVPEFAGSRPPARCRLACQFVLLGPCHLVPLE